MNRRAFITQAAAFAALGPAVAQAMPPMGYKGIDISIPRRLTYIGDYDLPPVWMRLGDCWFDNVQRKFMVHMGRHFTNITDFIIGVQHNHQAPPGKRITVCLTAFELSDPPRDQRVQLSIKEAGDVIQQTIRKWHINPPQARPV